MDLETYATRLAARIGRLEEAIQERETLIALMAAQAGGEVKVDPETQAMLERIARVTWTGDESGLIIISVEEKEGSS